LITDLGLNWYGTTHRNYDPTLGRFWGIDKMADLFPSITPMLFGYNNPVLFNDPLGLFGDDPDDPDEPVDRGTLPVAVVVTATRLNEDGSQDFSWLNRYIGSGDSPIRRFMVSQGEKAYDTWHTNRTIHFGSQPKKSKWMEDFNRVFGTALNVGVTGTIVAAFAAPALVNLIGEGSVSLSAGSIKTALFGTSDVLSKGYLTKVGFNMGVETVDQLITSSPSQIDFADIAAQGFLGLNTPQSAAFGAVVDFKPFANNYSFLNLNSGTFIDFTTGFIAGKVSGLGPIQGTMAQPLIQWGSDLSMKVVAGGFKKTLE
jgi:RHS repeat-associated protein